MGLLDLKRVTSNYMEIIKDEQELYEINGGISFTSNIINSIVASAKIILEIGRSLGSSIRRSTSGNMC